MYFTSFPRGAFCNKRKELTKSCALDRLEEESLLRCRHRLVLVLLPLLLLIAHFMFFFTVFLLPSVRGQSL